MRIAKQIVGRRGAMGLILAWLGLCTGCGGNVATVQGSVTFDGKPVEEGSIVFEPADGKGPAAGATIKNGTYLLGGKGGVAPGKKIVRIIAVRPTGRKIEAGPPNPPGTMVDELTPYIPAVYNQQSTLTIDVTAGGVTKDFELVSQPPPS